MEPLASVPKYVPAVDLPPLCVGTFQQENPNVLGEIVAEAVHCGFRAFDTAPSYRNESLLGSLLRKQISEGNVARQDLFLIDKIDGWQMFENGGNVESHVVSALEKLQTDYLDAVLIHWPFPEVFHQTWASLLKAHERGLIKWIGCCNVGVRHLRKLREVFPSAPHLIQIERHPLNTETELLAYCRENCIRVLGYSPLCRMVPSITESKILASLRDKYQRSIAQIILRWQQQQGVTPVFMTTKTQRLREYAALSDFDIESDDLRLIQGMDEQFRLFVPSRCCPGY